MSIQILLLNTVNSLYSNLQETEGKETFRSAIPFIAIKQDTTTTSLIIGKPKSACHILSR